jgi:hypothetical protein
MDGIKTMKTAWWLCSLLMVSGCAASPDLATQISAYSSADEAAAKVRMDAVCEKHHKAVSNTAEALKAIGDATKKATTADDMNKGIEIVGSIDFKGNEALANQCKVASAAYERILAVRYDASKAEVKIEADNADRGTINCTSNRYGTSVYTECR